MTLSIRQIQSDEDIIIVKYFYLMWQDYAMHSILKPDWQEESLRFIKVARAEHSFAGFIAEVAGKPVGSAACQLFQGLYPSIFQAEKRNYGYIWGIYVLPEYRKKGLATKLTQACCTYLKSIACSKVILHASPMGKPVYERLGFAASNEMAFELNTL